jgi:hypothetical protein
MNNMDINVLLTILDYLSVDDVLSYCSSSSDLFKLCNKYSNSIWERLLWRDYKISKDQIIGQAKSYYFGLKYNKGYYYFYDLDTIYEEDNIQSNIFTVNRLELISKEDSKWDDHFYVPGINQPKDEKVIVGVFHISRGEYGSEYISVVGKTLDYTKKILVDKVNYQYLDNFEIENIKNIQLYTTFKQKIIYDDLYDDEEYDVEIQFFEADL